MNGFRHHFTGFRAIYRRELRAYFATPLAYVFLVVFLIALGLFTWEVGNFFDNGTVDLSAFFVWHPWLYMIFLPALAMRLWSDERAAGTDELLLSLPLGLPGMVLSKLLASWTVALIGLALTFPMWVTANYLGDPDNAAIFLTYIMSGLMAGAYLSIGAAVSASTGSQVTAFVISVVIAFLFTVAGWPLVLSSVSSIFGSGIAESVAKFSFLTHFEAAQRGILELRAILFFIGFICFWAVLNGLWANHQRQTG